MKPRKYGAWDMLTLQDIIQNHMETSERQAKMHRNKVEMRAFYDHQIKAKRDQQEHERDLDRKLGQSIKEKVHRIDKLSSLNEHARLMKRGTIALENIGSTNSKKASEQ